MTDPIQSLRLDLAAACRIAARLGWQEGVANHFSVAVDEEGKRFLINPRWRLFAGIHAGDLLLLDARARPADLPEDLDATAWAIHGTMHAQLPHARCILHVHSTYATALSCLADRELPPIDQTSARFFRRVAVDTEYGGLADTAEEGQRLARILGDRQLLIMGNHGVLAAGPDIAQTFDALYCFEHAARTLMLAYASGRPLAILPDAVAEQTARSWEDGGAYARAHFAEWKRRLDAEGEYYGS